MMDGLEISKRINERFETAFITFHAAHNLTSRQQCGLEQRNVMIYDFNFFFLTRHRIV